MFWLRYFEDIQQQSWRNVWNPGGDCSQQNVKCAQKAAEILSGNQAMKRGNENGRKKVLTIDTMICDLRTVSEETLQSYEKSIFPQ